MQQNMDKFITSREHYSIWQLSKNGLFDLATFVVVENYKRHQKVAFNRDAHIDEILDVYNEDVRFFEQSKILVAKNDKNEIVGAIRLLKWNRKDELPITKLFGITNLSEISPEDSNAHIWHVGRFAVSADLGRYGISLFRILMMYAVTSMCEYEKGIMFAECDSKLLKTMSLMGLKAVTLDNGIEYLGSVTIPIYITRSGMAEFVAKNQTSVLHVESVSNKQSYAHTMRRKDTFFSKSKNTPKRVVF